MIIRRERIRNDRNNMNIIDEPLRGRAMNNRNEIYLNDKIRRGRIVNARNNNRERERLRERIEEGMLGEIVREMG